MLLNVFFMLVLEARYRRSNENCAELLGIQEAANHRRKLVDFSGLVMVTVMTFGLLEAVFGLFYL
jgi:hypothetical protein